MHQGKALFLITQQAFECPCAQVLCWALARQRPLVRRAGTWTNSGDAVKAVARGWGSRPWEGRILARRAEAWGRPRQGSGGGQDRGLGESRGLGEGRAGVWGRKGLVCCPPPPGVPGAPWSRASCEELGSGANLEPRSRSWTHCPSATASKLGGDWAGRRRVLPLGVLGRADLHPVLPQGPPPRTAAP